MCSRVVCCCALILLVVFSFLTPSAHAQGRWPAVTVGLGGGFTGGVEVVLAEADVLLPVSRDIAVGVSARGWMSPVDDIDIYVPGGTRVDYINGGWSSEAQARYYLAASRARVRPFVGGAAGVHRWTGFEQSELQRLASLYAGTDVSLSQRLSASAQLRVSRHSDEPFERRFGEALNSLTLSTGLRVQM